MHDLSSTTELHVDVESWLQAGSVERVRGDCNAIRFFVRKVVVHQEAHRDRLMVHAVIGALFERAIEPDSRPYFANGSEHVFPIFGLAGLRIVAAGARKAV